MWQCVNQPNILILITFIFKDTWFLGGGGWGQSCLHDKNLQLQLSVRRRPEYCFPLLVVLTTSAHMMQEGLSRSCLLTVCTRYLSLGSDTQEKQLKGGRNYCVSQLKGTQSIMAWRHASVASVWLRTPCISASPGASAQAGRAHPSQQPTSSSEASPFKGSTVFQNSSLYPVFIKHSTYEHVG